MQADELKSYIYEHDKVPMILESLGCHHINDKSSKEHRAGLPNESNPTKISIKKTETLKSKVYLGDTESLHGDIFTLIMHINKCNFPDSVKYIHNLLGLEYKPQRKKEEVVKKQSPLDIFKKIKTKYKRFDVKEIEIYSTDIMREYTPNLHLSWLREGILSFTARKFAIGYSYDSKRIIIPERLWCGEPHEFVGIMGRTTIENHELFDIPKYLAIKPYLRTVNLYGLQENYQAIQQLGYVSVHEAQKSVLKRHSRRDESGVAVGSHEISEQQARILLSLDVEIVVVMDKGITRQHIRSLCEKFYGKRKVSYIWDSLDLLKDKEAPADKIDKVYKYLFKNRIVYDEREHKEYLKELEKGKGENKWHNERPEWS